MKHLTLLRRGVKVWNHWRKEHPDEDIDLSRANLMGVDLSGADLSYADLSEANLSEADLSGANLYKANLMRTLVTEAQLKKAKSLDLATMPDGSKHR